MDFSPLSALKAALGTNLLFSLRDPNIREYPFAGLTTLQLASLSMASLVFLKGHPVANALVASVLTWWITFVFSIIVLLLFGLKAPERHLRKATYVTMSAFTAACLLFSLNLLPDFDSPAWLGNKLGAGIGQYFAVILYVLPFTTFSLISSRIALKSRVDQISLSASARPRCEAAQRLDRALWRRALASFAAVTAFSALLLWLVVVRNDSGFSKIVEAMQVAGVAG